MESPISDLPPAGSGSVSDSSEIDREQPGESTSPRRGPWTTGRLITLAVVVLLLGAFVLFWVHSTSGSSSGVVQVGKSATNFSLPGLGSKSVSLANYRGQVVLVNFWATWCVPCKTEMPQLQSVYQADKGAGFTILGVDQAESAGAVQAFVKNHGFDWTFALDQSGDTSRAYGVYAIPESFLIDRSGKVAYIWTSSLTRGSLEQQLASLGIGR